MVKEAEPEIKAIVSQALGPVVVDVGYFSPVLCCIIEQIMLTMEVFLGIVQVEDIH